MATVHFGRLIGPVGFSRTVAIKRLHPHLSKDPEFVKMFMEEARIAARIRHPNVVTTHDVVALETELFLVMDYVHGESLSRLVRKMRQQEKRIPVKYTVSIMCGALEGLHAAHEAKSERGMPLGIVHRDVSPQNVLVGVDGAARVLDFGVAKATNKVSETRTDQIKGKVAYMGPEQLSRGRIDRRTDVYAASVVLWEALTGQRLFQGEDVTSLVYSVVSDKILPPSTHNPEVSGALDDIVMRGLSRELEQRWPSARDMAMALEEACSLGTPREIGAWVEETSGDALAWRAHLVSEIESMTSGSVPPPETPLAPSTFGPSDTLSGSGSGSGPTSSSSSIDRPPPSATTAPSQVTYLATSSGTMSAPGNGLSGRMMTVVIGLSAVIVLAAGVAIGSKLLGPRPEIAAPHPTATAIEPPTREEQETAIVVAVTPATGTPAAASASGSAAPPVAQIIHRGGHATTTTTEPTHTAVVAPPPPPPSDDCDNPFTVDSNGIRRPKPQCFKH
jgi:serine/threonine-protein kinase